MEVSSGSVLEYDLGQLNKLDKFSGDEAQYPEWAFPFRAFIDHVQCFSHDELQVIEHAPEPFKTASLGPKTRAKSSCLHYVLSLLVRGKGQKILRGCEQGNGMEAWRQLSQAYEAAVGGAAAGVLSSILEYPFSADPFRFGDELLQWEILIADYDKQCPLEEVSEGLKKSVLTRSAPEPLRTQLEVLESDVPYTAFLKKVWNFVRSRQAWRKDKPQTAAESASSASNGTPMEVSAVYYIKGKGKGKDKGKGRGKFQQGPTQQGRAMEVDWSSDGSTTNWNLQCWTCWGWGHKENVCPSKGHGKGVNAIVARPEAEVPVFGAARRTGMTATRASGSPEIHTIRGEVDDLPEVGVIRDDGRLDEPLDEEKTFFHVGAEGFPPSWLS